MAHDVFISYSTKDKYIADAICHALEGNAIRCWIAPRDIALGSKWPKSITDAIASTKIMVLIFSNNSSSSDQVSNELILAMNKQKIVVPFIINQARLVGDFEYFLSRTHWLDAIDPPTVDQIERLVKYVLEKLTPINENNKINNEFNSQISLAEIAFKTNEWFYTINRSGETHGNICRFREDPNIKQILNIETSGRFCIVGECIYFDSYNGIYKSNQSLGSTEKTVRNGRLICVAYNKIYYYVEKILSNKKEFYYMLSESGNLKSYRLFANLNVDLVQVCGNHIYFCSDNKLLRTDLVGNYLENLADKVEPHSLYGNNKECYFIKKVGTILQLCSIGEKGDSKSIVEIDEKYIQGAEIIEIYLYEDSVYIITRSLILEYLHKLYRVIINGDNKGATTKIHDFEAGLKVYISIINDGYICRLIMIDIGFELMERISSIYHNKIYLGFH